TGYTNSHNYPIAGPAYQTQLTSDIDPQAASINAVLTKLNPAGNGLLYSSYFGRIHYGDMAPIVYRGQVFPGTSVHFNELQEQGRGIAVDQYANAYIVGDTGGIQAIAVPIGENPPTDPAHISDAWLHAVNLNPDSGGYGGVALRWNLFANF